MYCKHYKRGVNIVVVNNLLLWIISSVCWDQTVSRVKTQHVTLSKVAKCNTFTEEAAYDCECVVFNSLLGTPVQLLINTNI